MIFIKCLRCRIPSWRTEDDLYCDTCDDFFKRVKKMSQRVAPESKRHAREKAPYIQPISRKSHRSEYES